MTCWPLDRGCIVTSAFGARDGGKHYGTDLGFPNGSAGRPVYAARAGRVIHVGAASGFGGPSPNGWIVVSGDDGTTHVYGHVVAQVQLGAQVREAQQIGYVNPNSSTNGGVVPHLHFEWHRSTTWAADLSKRVDPIPGLAAARFPGGAVTVSTQYECDVVDLSPSDSGQRDMRTVSIIVVHTNEGPADNPVANLLHYLADPANEVSYTVVVDGKGTTGRSNDDWFIPWAAGSPANERGLHLCLQGYSAERRDTWLARGAQLDAAAEVIADWSTRYGIPIVKLTGEQMKAGGKGIGGHDTTVDAWHATDHNDPGAAFPWDELLARAKRITDKGGKFMAALTDAEQRELYENTKWLREQLDVGNPKWGAGSSLGLTADGKPFTFRDSFADLRRRLLAGLPK